MSANSIRQAAQQGLPDLYLPALLAPRAVRGDLIAVVAFAAEMRRIPFVVRDPSLGEIRLQWWRDTLTSPDHKKKAGHDIADSLRELISRRSLGTSPFLRMIDAVSFLFGTEPPNETELEAHVNDGFAQLFRVQAAILMGAVPDKTITDGVARSFGRAALARDLNRHIALGRMPLPLAYFDGADPRFTEEAAAVQAIRAAHRRLGHDARIWLSSVSSQFPKPPRALLPLFLPLALVEPIFSVLDAPHHDPLRDIADISPLSRAMNIGLARLKGGL